jgi:hypothetical protein
MGKQTGPGGARGSAGSASVGPGVDNRELTWLFCRLVYSEPSRQCSLLPRDDQIAPHFTRDFKNGLLIVSMRLF